MPQSGVAIAIGRNSFDPPAPVVPCFDVHNRSSILHDDSASGIFSFHAANNHLILNPSTSGAAAVCTAVYVDVYSTTSEGIQDLTSPRIITIGATRAVSNSLDFQVNSNTIDIFAPGTYEITYRYSIDQTSTTRRSVRGWLEIDDGSGFSEIAGSRHWTYSRISTGGEDSSEMTLILSNITAGSAIRMLVAVNSSSGAGVIGLSTISGGSSLTLLKVE
jgi:hypothetical protein